MATKLAVFSLPAIIRYSELEMKQMLLEALAKELQINCEIDDLEGQENYSQALFQLVESKTAQAPSQSQIDKVNRRFQRIVKDYFINNEEAFEVRPGVQSLFAQIEKEKAWKYCIISDYSQAVTQFILQSCGVFSKNKLTLTASDALSADDQLKLARKRAQKKDKKIKIYLICSRTRPIDSNLATLVEPKYAKGSPNYFTYPRFGELFRKKKKKKVG
jgi:hypothetical protein